MVGEAHIIVPITQIMEVTTTMDIMTTIRDITDTVGGIITVLPIGHQTIQVVQDTVNIITVVFRTDLHTAIAVE